MSKRLSLSYFTKNEAMSRLYAAKRFMSRSGERARFSRIVFNHEIVNDFINNYDCDSLENYYSVPSFNTEAFYRAVMCCESASYSESKSNAFYESDAIDTDAKTFAKMNHKHTRQLFNTVKFILYRHEREYDYEKKVPTEVINKRFTRIVYFNFASHHHSPVILSREIDKSIYRFDRLPEYLHLQQFVF